jgi:hypothetical protein
MLPFRNKQVTLRDGTTVEGRTWRELYRKLAEKGEVQPIINRGDR